MTNAPQNSSNQFPRVLVIDDSPDVHRLLRARLKQEEIEIASVMGGAEGLAEIKNSRPDLILLDLDMPGMDGFEVLRSIKDDAQTVHIPVVVLSGLASPEDKVNAFDFDW